MQRAEFCGDDAEGCADWAGAACGSGAGCACGVGCGDEYDGCDEGAEEGGGEYEGCEGRDG